MVVFARPSRQMRAWQLLGPLPQAYRGSKAVSAMMCDDRWCVSRLLCIEGVASRWAIRIGPLQLTNLQTSILYSGISKPNTQSRMVDAA